jgi:hypothetical protein
MTVMQCVAVLVVALLGCATTAQHRATDERVERLRQRIAKLEKAADAQASTTATSHELARRLSVVEARPSPPTADLAALRRDLLEIKNRLSTLEATDSRVDQLITGAAIMLKQLDDRVTAVEGKRTPVAGKPAQPPAAEGQGWWCVSDADFGACHRTLVECEARRASLANAEDCEKSSGLSRDECVAISARARGVGRCEQQARAACFTKHHILQRTDELACAPTIALCQQRRTTVIKGLGADQKVKSECKAVD